MSVELIVETADLTHRFGSRTALERVSLRVPKGSIFALLGPNGGGKTTLFRILTNLLRPTSGTARVAGADVVRQRGLVRRRLGVVFQHPSLDKKLTAFENMLHQGMLHGLSGARLRGKSRELLDRFGLADRAADRVETLSGGMQRRVEIAKSLLHQPQLLILDEPSTGLDPGARADLMHMLRELRQRDGTTCLLTTHLMEEAENCDQVAILDKGWLVASGTPSSLTSTVGGEIITIKARDPTGFAAKAGKRFQVNAHVVDGSVYIERQRGHEFVPMLIEAFPGEIDAVTVGRPRLDHVFLRLTGHRLADVTAEATHENRRPGSG